MTGKNVLVAIGFAIITVTQLVLGMILIVYAAERGGEAKSLYRKGKLHSNWLFALMRPRSPTAPTDTPSGVPQLRICPEQTRGDCAYRHFHFFWWVGLNKNHLVLMRRSTNIDFLAFSLTMFVATRSKAHGLKVSAIFRTIAEDATRYFMIIIASHFVVEMTLNLARVSSTGPLSAYG